MSALRLALILLLFASPASSQTKTLTAPEFIATVKAAAPKGGVYLRGRMEQTSATGKTVLQLQIKRRSLANGASEHLYQLLFPKERKGESLLLHVKGNGFSGSSFIPGKGVTKLTSADRKLKVFGTDMTIDDILTDFLDWPKPEIVAHEKIGTADCSVVLCQEGSKKVKCWMDEKRYVPMKIEFYDSGDQPARIVETGKVVRMDSGYFIPVSFTLSTPATGTSTLIEGTRSDAVSNYSDADFTEASMQVLSGAPK
jgi:outer membrane lipoprotein-sorting protein